MILTQRPPNHLPTVLIQKANADFVVLHAGPNGSGIRALRQRAARTRTATESWSKPRTPPSSLRTNGTTPSKTTRARLRARSSSSDCPSKSTVSEMRNPLHPNSPFLNMSNQTWKRKEKKKKKKANSRLFHLRSHSTPPSYLPRRQHRALPERGAVEAVSLAFDQAGLHPDQAEHHLRLGACGQAHHEEEGSSEQGSAPDSGGVVASVWGVVHQRY